MPLTRPLDSDSGSQRTPHFALQMAVAARVSGREKFPCIQILLATGEVTSPNYPRNYPNYLNKTQTIKVEERLTLFLQFTAFDIEDYPINGNLECSHFDRGDHLTITDGDGTTLMEKSCGSTSSKYGLIVGGQSIGPFMPAAIRSRTNVVNLVFITTVHAGTRTGWSVSWSVVTSGECQQCNLVRFYFLVNKIIDDALKKTRRFQPNQTRLCLSFLF